MKDRDSIELLRRLSLAAGPPGAEDEVRDVVRQTLKELGPPSYDRLGSLLFEQQGSSSSPRVVLDSHLDEVGLMVQSVSPEGRLSFVPLGGWWAHVLLGQRFDVLGEKGRVPGVIGCTPPHFLSADEKQRLLGLDAMYVDVGASSREEVTALGLRVGDPVVPRSEFLEMAPDNVLSGKALDNRIGVALMCETLLTLQKREHPNTVIGVGAVQEEIGSRGAGTASELSRPDVALVLECTPADDLPGQPRPQALLGGGPQLRFYDPTAVANRRLVRLVERVAQELEIPLQLAVRSSGGTDAATIHRHRSGVPTVVIGVPARYIHSHAGVMRLDDYKAALALVIALTTRLDGAQVAQLVDFS